jgi:hypothetical protein
LSALVLALFPCLLPADTTYVSGEVSGIFDVQGSPYIVTDVITVPSDSTLVIEPGVHIVFESYYRFFVNGRLDARGTESDSIVFRALLEDSTWGGLRFVEAQDTSFVAYCRFENGEARAPCPDCYGGGIYCDRSDVIIERNLIQYCDASSGGGIFAGYCDPIIRWNEIRYCEGGGGGGICAFHASPLISKNVLYSDSAWSGGGICLYSSGGTIQGNRIFENWAESKGGGIFCQNSSPLIESNEISFNRAEEAGGGIAVNDSLAPLVRYNNISKNQQYGLYQGNPDHPVDAAENFWGDATGPYHPTLNPDGLGDSVSDHVEFVPWATEPGVFERPVSRGREVGPSLRIVPVPARSSGDVLLEISDSNGSMGTVFRLKVTDVSGRTLASLEMRGDEVLRLLDRCPGLQSGIYFVVLRRSGENRTLVSKLILLP